MSHFLFSFICYHIEPPLFSYILAQLFFTRSLFTIRRLLFVCTSLCINDIAFLHASLFASTRSIKKRSDRVKIRSSRFVNCFVLLPSFPAACLAHQTVFDNCAAFPALPQPSLPALCSQNSDCLTCPVPV